MQGTIAVISWLISLGQGSAKSGPRAKSGPQALLIPPAAARQL